MVPVEEAPSEPTPSLAGDESPPRRAPREHAPGTPRARFRPFVFDDDDLIAEVAGWSMTVTLFVLLMIRADIGLDGKPRVGMTLLFLAALLPLFCALYVMRKLILRVVPRCLRKTAHDVREGMRRQGTRISRQSFVMAKQRVCGVLSRRRASLESSLLDARRGRRP